MKRLLGFNKYQFAILSILIISSIVMYYKFYSIRVIYNSIENKEFIVESIVMIIVILSQIYKFYFSEIPAKEAMLDKEIKSDEKKLLDKKNEFLSNILETLKLDIDKDLKKYLEDGNIDEANAIIEGKINALNVLVETVRGNNSKSLRGTEISSVSEFYDSTSNRIRNEITRQQENGKSNRSIGITATIIAITVLMYTLLGNVPTTLISIAPRVALSILIESFAFFFFYQYRKNQEEIKYWNNEKTDLDLKIFALSLAIDDSDIGTKEFMQGIIEGILKQEHNLIQKKDEKETNKGSDLVSNNLVDDFIGKVQKLSSSFIGDKKG